VQEEKKPTAPAPTPYDSKLRFGKPKIWCKIKAPNLWSFFYGYSTTCTNYIFARWN
jgi:hypothetical protein